MTRNERENPTSDLARFGYREIKLAMMTLEAYLIAADDNRGFVGDGVKLWYDTESGYVFLMSDDYRIGMLNNEGELEEFFVCSECGREGFIYGIAENVGVCEGCREIATRMTTNKASKAMEELR